MVPGCLFLGIVGMGCSSVLTGFKLHSRLAASQLASISQQSDMQETRATDHNQRYFGFAPAASSPEQQLSEKSLRSRSACLPTWSLERASTHFSVRTPPFVGKHFTLLLIVV